MQRTTECTHCGSMEKCKKREFSAQAWTALVVWGEIEESVVDSPICMDCYNELRDVLIDRADEIDQFACASSAAAQSSKDQPGKVA